MAQYLANAATTHYACVAKRFGPGNHVLLEITILCFSILPNQ
jgi:hypothetical protein